MAETVHVQEPKNFAPKDPPKLNPPKDDPISLGDLARCDGTTATDHNRGNSTKLRLIERIMAQARTLRILPT